MAIKDNQRIFANENLVIDLRGYQMGHRFNRE